jgi:hypothetical protein
MATTTNTAQAPAESAHGSSARSVPAPNDAAIADIYAAAQRLPTRRTLTQRAAARWQRRTVTRLLDEIIDFDSVGSMTERARWREEILADLARSRRDHITQARAQARARGGWSL